MAERRSASGPLAGLRVIEFASIGPGPHCAMLLADMGADVLRIDRAGGNGWPNPIADRGRAVKAVDIRTKEGCDFCRQAARKADVLIEGFRPGVMERLQLGPDKLCGLNPRLVYARMTGWGQDGPLSTVAGHDINYIALTGALAAMGRSGEPATVPLNLVGDFGGGSMFLAFGILASLLERERSGMGQVIDAAIVDGVASLMTMFTGLLPSGLISVDRDRNILGGAAPFYRCYLCRDGREISVGPLEPQFFRLLVKKLGLTQFLDMQMDESRWDEMTGAFEKVFASQDRDYWSALFDGADACVAPVLTVGEVLDHPHHRTRGTFVEHQGLVQAAPAPRFSRTSGAIQPTRAAEQCTDPWWA